MHYLVIDTCVWVDLAVSEFSLVEKLFQLVDTKKVRVVLPEVVKDEWNRCRAKVSRQVTTEIKKTRSAAIEIASFLQGSHIRELSSMISVIDPMSKGKQISAQRIKAIEEIMEASSTIAVQISLQVKLQAVAYALDKKAPFRQRNSMGDALIFFAAIEWANSNTPFRSVFVTHNTKDFSETSGGEADHDSITRLAPELQTLADESGMRYGIIFGRVLNEVEEAIATEAEVEREEAAVLTERMLADLAQLFGQRTAHIFSQEEVSVGAALLRDFDAMSEVQRQFAEALANPASDFNRQVEAMSEVQRRLEAVMKMPDMLRIQDLLMKGLGRR